MKRDMVARMAERPLVFALANPNPEILPEHVKEVRDDAVIATGRTDYPNQVNNVLCFPFIFRGALDVGATTITRSMEVAAVHAVAALAQVESSDEVAAAYGDAQSHFGAEYLIPRPFDPRLIVQIAPAVAQAAMDAGVATRPIDDFDAYRSQLQQFVYHSGNFMKPIFAASRDATRCRVAFADGEEERVLRAVQVICDEKIARPILIGRPAVIDLVIERQALRIRAGHDFDVVNPEHDDRYREYWQTYLQLTRRQGVSEQLARLEVRRQMSLIGALMMHRGEADAMICGIVGEYAEHLRFVDQVIGKCDGASVYAAMNILMLPGRQITVVDTHVNRNPDAQQIAEITIRAAQELNRYGIVPKAALLSHSNFGTSDAASAQKMRDALAIIRRCAPELDIDGEMHGDMALNVPMRALHMPESPLDGEANLLVMPNLDAANISYNLLKVVAGQGVAIGPILLGANRPVHVMTPSSTIRRIVNMTAWAVIDANHERTGEARLSPLRTG